MARQALGASRETRSARSLQLRRRLVRALVHRCGSVAFGALGGLAFGDRLRRRIARADATSRERQPQLVDLPLFRLVPLTMRVTPHEHSQSHTAGLPRRARLMTCQRPNLWPVRSIRSRGDRARSVSPMAVGCAARVVRARRADDRIGFGNLNGE
jgi:hypothetical protein